MNLAALLAAVPPEVWYSIGSMVLTTVAAKAHTNGTQFPVLSAIFNAFGLLGAPAAPAPAVPNGRPLLTTLRNLLAHPQTTEAEAQSLINIIAQQGVQK